MGGWVGGAGKLGVGAGPGGGARLIAPPDGSGTEAGGIGGGWSVNIWAETTAGIPKTSTAASAHAKARRLPRPDPVMPLPPRVMRHAFHRKRGKFKPADRLCGAGRDIGKKSRCRRGGGARCSRNPCLVRPDRGINHACGWFWQGLTLM